MPTVWGVSTLVGPAIGGAFAAYDAWRAAFFVLVPCAVLLGALAIRVIPNRSDEAGMQAFPIPQILLLVGAVLAVSVASILTEGAMLPALLVGLAVLAIIALGVIDRHRETRLLPRGTFSPSSGLAALFAAGLGAAVAGVIVNAAGLASGRSVSTTIAAANWLYGLFTAVPLLTIPIVWSIVHSERREALEQPAE